MPGRRIGRYWKFKKDEADVWGKSGKAGGIMQTSRKWMSRVDKNCSEARAVIERKYKGNDAVDQS